MHCDTGKWGSSKYLQHQDTGTSQSKLGILSPGTHQGLERTDLILGMKAPRWVSSCLGDE